MSEVRGPRPWRIVYASSSPNGGGALNYLVDLVEHHDRAAYACCVYLDSGIREADRAITRLTAAGVDVRYGPLASPFDGLRHPGWWRRELRRAGPVDLANLHQHVPGAGWMFLEGARAAGVPLLLRTEQLPRFPPHERLRLWPPRAAYRLARHRLAGITDHRIVVSEGSREALAKRGEPRDAISVVPTAYNEAAYTVLTSRAEARLTLGLPMDRTLVGFVASLTHQKRPELFLRAAARLRSRQPDALFLVGGTGYLERAVQARARRIGPAVRILGLQADMPRLLAALDLFVLPSMYEGLPLTILEAMRAGTAVLATAVDGTPELVRDGETGRLVPPGDLDALTRVMGELLDDPAQRDRLALAGQRFVTGRFDAATLARRTEQVYAALRGPGAPRP